MATRHAEFDAVVALLPQLSADQQHAVALRLAGLSPAEIAEVLGKSWAALDMILHRALVRLQELTASEIPPETTPATGGDRRD